MIGCSDSSDEGEGDEDGEDSVAMISVRAPNSFGLSQVDSNSVDGELSNKEVASQSCTLQQTNQLFMKAME